jgi:16S rRNA (adenine1518-N6/adenine1519-N6)-dimethyltransferase
MSERENSYFFVALVPIRIFSIMYKKKSLGQHFLHDQRILAKVADAADLSASDVVLEVGPGEGTLTEFLLQRAGKVIAVEKDDRLIQVLQNRFQNEIAAGKLELMHADILKLSIFNDQFSKRGEEIPHPSGPLPLGKGEYKVVANLPYYITGQFLRRFLQSKQKPSSMTLLLQKEVARRIVAADGKESLLSISVKAYGAPRYVATVKAGAFTPPPKVDSAILAIKKISRSFFDGISEKDFFSILKRGFAHPRKLLASNLGVSAKFLAESGIALLARAENLSLEQWRALVTLGKQ